MEYQKSLSAEAGVSLITVFFIMTIVLSVVLSLSLILLNELKNTSSFENSLVAFYLADSGVEKLLYYDKQQIPSVPPGINSGICNICNADTSLATCQTSGDDCIFCRSCEVNYSTSNGSQGYDTTARIFPNGNFFNMDITVKGFYKDTTRAIGLQIANKDLSSSAPVLQNVSASRDPNTGLVIISADVVDPDGVDQTTVKAHIRNSTNPNDPDSDTVFLSLPNGLGDTYTGAWSGPDGYYYIYVRACDSVQPFPNCGESIRFPITSQ